MCIEASCVVVQMWQVYFIWATDTINYQARKNLTHVTPVITAQRLDSWTMFQTTHILSCFLFFQFFLSSKAVWVQYFSADSCTKNATGSSTYADDMCLQFFVPRIMYSCSNGVSVTQQEWNNDDCSGPPSSSTTIPAGQCNDGEIFNCGSAPTPSTPFFRSLEFDSTTCQGSPFRTEFASLDQCLLSSFDGSYMFTCTTNGLVLVRGWSSPDCSGPALGTQIRFVTKRCFHNSYGGANIFCSSTSSPAIPFSIMSAQFFDSPTCQGNPFQFSDYVTNICQYVPSLPEPSSRLYICNGTSAIAHNFRKNVNCSGTPDESVTYPLNKCTESTDVTSLITENVKSPDAISLIIQCSES